MIKLKRIKQGDFILVFFIVLFAIAVGVLIFKEARRSNLVLNQEEAIQFFSEKINEISPEKSVLGGQWHVLRFRFVKGLANQAGVYVEYEDGHIARAFLVALEGSAGSLPNYRIAGFFEPEPNGYKLLAGEDLFKDKPQEIYEYNETAKNWIKVN